VSENGVHVVAAYTVACLAKRITLKASRTLWLHFVVVVGGFNFITIVTTGRFSILATMSIILFNYY